MLGLYMRLKAFLRFVELKKKNYYINTFPKRKYFLFLYNICIFFTVPLSKLQIKHTFFMSCSILDLISLSSLKLLEKKMRENSTIEIEGLITCKSIDDDTKDNVQENNVD